MLDKVNEAVTGHQGGRTRGQHTLWERYFWKPFWHLWEKLEFFPKTASFFGGKKYVFSCEEELKKHQFLPKAV